MLVDHASSSHAVRARGLSHLSLEARFSLRPKSCHHHHHHAVLLSHWHSSMGRWQTAQASRNWSVGLAASRVQIKLIHYSLVLNLAWAESNASILFYSNVGVLHVLVHCTSNRFKLPSLNRLSLKAEEQSKGFVFVQLPCSQTLEKKIKYLNVWAHATYIISKKQKTTHSFMLQHKQHQSTAHHNWWDITEPNRPIISRKNMETFGFGGTKSVN